MLIEFLNFHYSKRDLEDKKGKKKREKILKKAKGGLQDKSLGERHDVVHGARAYNLKPLPLISWVFH
jgi:hypothetical protein